MANIKYHRSKSGKWTRCHANFRPCPNGGEHISSLPVNPKSIKSVEDVFKLIAADRSAKNKKLSPVRSYPESLKGLTISRKVAPRKGVANRLHTLGYSAPPVYQIDSTHADFFCNQILTSKENNKFHACVHVYSKEEYAEMKMYVTADGKSGFAIKPDGDIVSVFSHSDAKDKKVAPSLLATAISEGGSKLDCFDTVLPQIYKSVGFKEVERFAWDDQYKPEGWEEETYSRFNNGKPDVVMMEWDKNHAVTNNPGILVA